ncbi:SPOR domain-containing protein [Alteriqipengyuania lutimaris]|uniref:SPOR domain-containing protein n=1 Tax=Alteriqipengyuania lutimaris TaxID=1538146 RepID=A0A395LPH9_9SPHN|nr:SPOR domain-containing protein [Alteriqipengyuania lutimaris]MBB3033527.1 Flp pilus assembly protein TadD [Alteriqipengyuania lutimaris]RDS77464.1 SPOR domain-containing protein [Alteriqipengyuania lutimaris]
MIRPTIKHAMLAATATAALALTGCAGGIGGSRSASASDAAAARADGETEKAVALAEAAALAAPSDPAAKAELGSSYLAAGRFVSAFQAFDDALVLGDVSPQTALGFVLAAIATGEQRAALETLGEWRDVIAPSDLGLAYALAGNPEMGAQVLSNALRAGQNTARVRQNLAYAHALGGQWAAARIIAAQDVAPDELDERISSWARTARPEEYTIRVANLLGVQPQVDDGMPARLALGAAAATGELLAQAGAKADMGRPAADTRVAASGELPAVDLLASRAPTRSLPPLDPSVGANSAGANNAPRDFGSAFGEDDAVAASRVVSSPVVQKAPPRAVAQVAAAVPQPAPKAEPKPTARVASSQDLAGGSHLVQLGSYGSEADARRGWAILSERYPQVAGREQVITRAKVRGKIYYRLSAGNLAATSARSLCATVKKAGQGCIAWEESKPLPGTLDSGRRVASR